MAERRRRAISTPGDRQDPSARSPGSIALSLGLHLIGVILFLQVTVMQSSWLQEIMRRDPPVPVERIGFLQLPRGETPREAPRRGGDNLPVTSSLPRPTLVPVAPAQIPSTLPPIRTTPVPRIDVGGSGPLVGGGGDTRGVRPSFTEPSLWAPAGPVVTAPLSRTQRLDSALAPAFAALADSIRRAAGQRDPNDWTKTIGGKKYGIDSKYIRLGPVSIPTPLLALLPLNVQGNPTAMERQRRYAYMRGEIEEQAMRAARDEDFKSAVKALRERKQKERDEKKKADPPAKIIP